MLSLSDCKRATLPMRELLWRIILLTSRQQEKEGLRSRKAHKDASLCNVALAISFSDMIRPPLITIPRRHSNELP
jgi:hypothetical protein